MSQSKNGVSVGIVANAKFVNLRMEPNRSSRVYCKLSKGSRVPIIGEHGDYYKVSRLGFPNGYVAKHFIELDSSVSGGD